ncbi:hypothetical protein JCM19039_4704 [Geomicrobium sp. JCM 19039]|nr:hypothetical protein JCM19039_4704 [Geomicrobium sp. JCM 19039]
MLKRWFVPIISVAFLLGCGPSTESADSAVIHQMESFQNVAPDSSIAIDDRDVLRTMQRWINSGSAQPGAVDTTDPHFKVEFPEESFYIWTTPEGGSIMDTEDTHTLHSMTNWGNENMRDFLKQYFTLEDE